MGKERLYLMLCIALLFFGTVIGNVNIVTAADTTISVEPPAIVDDTLGPGSSFSVNVTISNVENLGGYDFWLSYNTSVLSTSVEDVTVVTDWFNDPTYGFRVWKKIVDDTLGYVRLWVTLGLGATVGVEGNGTVATIKFTVDALGTTVLDLNNTLLGDPFAEPISHGASDGFFTNNPQTHDVAVTYVGTNVTAPIHPGQAVNITVVVENQGDFFETFAVAALNETSMAAPAQIVTDLPPRKNQTLYFIWNTTGLADGDYTIKGMADTVTDETDTADNIKEDGTVTISHEKIYDIAITAVTPSTDTIPSGETMSITVVAKNEGTETETFDVTTTYHNATITKIIETQTVSDLATGDEEELTFTWNTIGVAEGVYTISGNATVLPGEIDTDDNVKEDGTVTVGPPIFHDLSVSAVTVSPETVKAGETVSITVTVKNEGNVAENNFYVIAKYDDTEFARAMILSLNPGEEKSQPFNVDTTGIVPGTYTVKGEVSTVAGETDTADNVKEDGTLTVLPVVHDIAVTNVTVSSNTVTVGQTVSINVTVKNEGTEAETFDVTTYYNDSTIETQTVSDLASEAEQTLTFTWNTTGVSAGTYVVKANASYIEGETDTADNVKEDGTLTVLPVVHDIAVTNVSASPDTVTAGQNVSIAVIVKNEGETAETFDVVVRSNDTEIDTQTVADLAAGGEQTLTFTWDTSGVAAGTYTIEAEASTVAGETDTADNIMEGGTVTVQGAPAPELLLYGAVVAILVAAVIIGYFMLIRTRKSKRT